MQGEASFTLTGFGDEISTDLQEQLDVLASEGIRHLELRAIWGKNVLDLDDSEVARAREILTSNGFSVSAVASPIGKVPVDTDFERYLSRFERALAMADEFGAHYVRVFSFYPPSTGGVAPFAEVVRRLRIFAERASAAGVVLLHENEQEIYGTTPQRCLELVTAVDSPSFQVAFDPANFIQAGVTSPFDEGYPLLADHIEYVHIKDAVLADGTIRLPGQGDGQIRELLAALKARGYSGFLSMEPHLSMAGRMAGFSGPALFAEAIRALKAIVAEL